MRTRITSLAAHADILIEDWGAGGLEDAELAPEAFLEANARLAIVRISPWGQQGPGASRPASRSSRSSDREAIHFAAGPPLFRIWPRANRVPSFNI